MKNLRIFISLILCVSMFSILNAQNLQTGSIKGIVTDDEGMPLPGVIVTARSPSLMGSMSDVTDAKGSYRCAALPPGTYTVVAELGAFSTVSRGNVILKLGAVVKINIEMSPSPIGEEITVIAPSPTVDVESTRVGSTIGKNLMVNIPMGRGRSTIEALSPGVRTGGSEVTGSIVHGGTQVQNAIEMDGVNKIDPGMNRPYTEIQYDAVEEVEVMTGGLPAQVGNTSGSYINIVTKSGGNEFSGMAQIYYTNEDLQQVLFSDRRIETMNVGKPRINVYDLDTSVALGGPIFRDKLWFFGNFTLKGEKRPNAYVPVEIEGTLHPAYDIVRKQWQGFFKLTAQISKNLKFFALGGVGFRYAPLRTGRYKTYESTTQYDPKSEWTVVANLSWHPGPNTFIDLRSGFVAFWENQVPRAGVHYNITKVDDYTGYWWGSASGGGETSWATTVPSSVRMAHFKDDFLGADHEFRAGISFTHGYYNLSQFKGDATIWHFYDGNPYSYRGLYDLDEPHPIYGDGKIDLYNAGPDPGDMKTEGFSQKFGGFVQDSMTIKERLTLNLGVRVDRQIGNVIGNTKKASGGIAEAVGEYYLLEEYGYNFYGEFVIDPWDKAMDYFSISPRIGIAYDLFGDGKTALKGTYSQYAESLPIKHFNKREPRRLNRLSWYWTDVNNNAVPDAPPIDTYELISGDPRQWHPTYYRNMLQEDFKAPVYDEWTVSINHELSNNLNVGIRYVRKDLRYQIDSAIYDTEAGRWWNTHELAPEYWIPFTTIVPAIGGFPDQEVTMYFVSNDSPDFFYRLGNRPEAKRRFRALELTFNKRMSNGWQLGGSFEFSSMKAHKSGGYRSVEGFTNSFNEANFMVNRYGPSYYDRPLVVKLFGTFELPVGFIGSFNFFHNDGRPWGRTVKVYPPSDWATANDTKTLPFSVNVEVGERRYQGTDILDVRLEKTFILGKGGKIGVFVDAFNLLGASYVDIREDPGGTWRPVAEDTNVGTYKADYRYGTITGIRGVRTFKFSVRFTF